MNILIVGGAGYIGSHAARLLAELGHKPVIFDNLSTGHKETVREFQFIKGDLRKPADIKKALKSCSIDAVMHFSALALVGESMEKPALYYENNITGGLNLLNAMIEAGVKKIIFSSSAAVYGIPKKVPVEENHPLNPINPYGNTKLGFERILEDYRNAYGIGFTALRYFNAAGASLDAGIGENHPVETHLIPRAILSAMGKLKDFCIFGTDYPTKDGTCVRDYVHVLDLAQAHILALEKLKLGRGAVYNLGSEKGFSVKEVVDLTQEVTGRKIKARYGRRRPGDPPVLVASSKKIKKELGWNPAYSDLKTIITTAYNWHMSDDYRLED
ncbi:MAG: UDP-glucose 4-epimerase GalE [Planctomycetes bacterium]|nr:UDP-glucose 4-epimerase GalE [Planctomycetota bacterium]